MKEELYHLGDRAYFNAVERVCRALTKHEHKYILVGGTGVQAHISNILSEGTKSIDELIEEGSLREGENLRRTNDCDIATTLNPAYADLVKTIESMEGEEDTDDNFYILKLERIGRKRPIARVTTYNEEEEARVMYNFSTEPKDLNYIGPEWYNMFIEGGIEIELVNQDLRGKFRVGKPEHLISAKLTRNSAKDQFDICSLLDTLYTRGMNFDFEEVKTILDVNFMDTYEHFYDGRMIRQIELDKLKVLSEN